MSETPVKDMERPGLAIWSNDLSELLCKHCQVCSHVLLYSTYPHKIV